MHDNNPFMYRLISRKQLPAICLAIIVLATTVYPGDSPWVCDEPILIRGALFYNATPSRIGHISLPFTLAATGLPGTRGVRYGPLAVWIDQFLLIFTHNPIHMLAVRAVVAAALTAIAVYWLCKSLRFSPWLAVVVMLSPWLWFYARQLWDNSLCVPLSAMLVASYADFLANRRRWALFLAVLCAMLLLLLHLMSLAIVAALALHLLIFERQALWKYKWIVAAIIVAVTSISARYWIFFFDNLHRDVPMGGSALLGYVFPVWGAHHISDAGLQDLYGLTWQFDTTSALVLAQRISLVAYPAVWGGMLLAAGQIAQAVRVTQFGAKTSLFVFAWLAVVSQSILHGLQRAYDGPHYFNASWIIYALFALIALNRLFAIPRFPKPAASSLVGIYAASLLFATASMAVTIHRNSGLHSLLFGATLSNQIAAVEEIQRYSQDSPQENVIPQWDKFPFALTVLQSLFPAAPGDHPTADLLICYRQSTLADLKIVVIPRSPQSRPSPP
jgi:hypothetical protein